MDLAAIGGGDSSIYTWGILPILIFLARVCDMTLDTLRIIFVSRGRRSLATWLGFFEILIWLFAISQALQHLWNPLNALAYAGGYGMGNYVGMTLEARIAVGRVLARVITRRDATPLIDQLRQQGFGLTLVPAEGAKGPVQILFSVIERHDLKKFLDLVRSMNPQAFISIEDIREAKEGHFPDHMPLRRQIASYLPFRRKGK